MVCGCTISDGGEVTMNKKLIAARYFGDAWAMIGDIQTLLAIANLRWTDVIYVKTFDDPEKESPYASIVRLWEETLTDGSKVYELHIL